MKRTVLILMSSLFFAISTFSQSGNFGDNLTWSFSPEGTLIISGTGAMPNYAIVNTPWHSYRSDITSVIIQEGVTTIGDNTFSDCRELLSVSIPDGVTIIGDDAFANCDMLNTINIPDGVMRIGRHAFEFCSDLLSMYIPESVTSIGSYAFNYCSYLEITGGENITEVEGGARTFRDTKWYRDQPQGLVYMGQVLLTYKGVSMPADITDVKEGTVSIAEGAFMENNDLKSIHLPVSITHIGRNAFRECSQMTTITGAENITRVDPYCFYDNPWYDNLSEEFNYLGYVLLKYDGTDTEITNIKQGTTQIAQGVFKGNMNITSVTIPNSVTAIGESAFEGCTGLSSIILPKNTELIEYAAFKGCTGLTSMTVKAETPPHLTYDDVFDNINKAIPVFVLATSIDAYNNAWCWSDFTNFQALQTFTLSFNTQDGSDVAAQTVISGELATAPVDPTKEGYIFIGWYKDESCTEAWDFDIETVNSDITLFAKWEDANPTCQQGISDNKISVYTCCGNVVVRCNSSEIITIYDFLGMQVKQVVAQDNETIIPLLQGTYIVKVGKATFKVISGSK